MNTYETLFIITPEIGDGEIGKTIDIIQDVITSGGGTILRVDKWGKRQLAYEIQKKREGYYVLMHFQAPVEALVELNRRFKLTEAIIRKIVLLLGKEEIADLLQSIEAEADMKPTDSSALHEDVDNQGAAVEETDEPQSDTETEDE